ncbi:MAG: hemolysin III family protein, partial [Octadecabacter sp.]|nr:hemolysin III family protein [Octadecabacter sp.]
MQGQTNTCTFGILTQRHTHQSRNPPYIDPMTPADPYPNFTRAERIADGILHAVGIAFAITATILLIVWASGDASPSTVVGLSIYGGALIGSFVASAVYHFTPWEGPRPILRRIDHAAIYLK